jgi:hypothetical protein
VGRSGEGWAGSGGAGGPGQARLAKARELAGGDRRGGGVGAASSAGTRAVRVRSELNRPSQLDRTPPGFRPFDRAFGKPGDPSYARHRRRRPGSRAAGQGQGQNNGALTPYQQVFTDFYDYALTSLDRSYVPLSVKDFVHDYFSSLDPSK